MSRKQLYIVAYLDTRFHLRDAPVKSYYRYNIWKMISGYSQAVRYAKKTCEIPGVRNVILWGRDGVVEPTNDGLDHFYIRRYWPGETR